MTASVRLLRISSCASLLLNLSRVSSIQLESNVSICDMRILLPIGGKGRQGKVHHDIRVMRAKLVCCDGFHLVQRLESVGIKGTVVNRVGRVTCW